MTQVTLNTLNNIEGMLNKHNEVSKKIDTLASGMDKSTNFKDIFDGKVKEGFSAKNKLETKETVFAIEDVRKNNLDADLSDLKVFKETLKQLMDEANVETSLDLTLAKDINEIISQLQEAVENATEMVEKTAEVNDEVEAEISTEVLSGTGLNISGLISQLNSVLQNPNQDVSIKDFQNGEKNIFEQILTFVNGKSDASLTKMELMQEEAINLKDVELNQAEFIELAENLVDEVVTNKESENININEMDINIDDEILKDLKIETVEVDVDTSSSETLLQNQTPEEQGMKAMLNNEVEGFEFKLDSVQTSQSTQSTQSTQTTQIKANEVNPSRIIDQIAKHLETLQNNSKVSIVLNPESLGKVNIQLLTTKEGLSAQFTVATQEARDLLMKGLDGLKETLVSHGVGVDNVSVKVADTQKSEYNADWTEQEGSRGGNKEQNRQDRGEKEKDLFEKLMAQTQEKENGNV